MIDVNKIRKEPFAKEVGTNNKVQMLVLSLLFDTIGMLSYTIPVLAEFSDVIWAPISSFLLFKMYKGTTGKLAAIFGFIEELFPFTDVIPTFTIVWFYTYVVKKGSSI